MTETLSTEELYDIYSKCKSVSTDSRKIRPGSLFFALRGEKFNGNTYAAEALTRGAAFAVVDDRSVSAGERFILVEDSLAALQDLAAFHRRKLGIPILAVTGTNGKTTTKELTARVLSGKYNVFATEGNLNNHIGVPLTLLSMDRRTEFGVVEMGASSVGEIAQLCRIAQPDFGIVTNIGSAHLEGFGSREGVRRGKGELYDYLAGHGGTAFYFTEDAELTGMVTERKSLKAIGYTLDEAAGIENPLAGGFNILNIAAAAAIGRYFGIQRDEIRNAIESYIPENNRSQRKNTGRNMLILDCYNANPSSMEAALKDFAAAPSVHPKAVILGDMLELGRHSTDEHRRIVTLLETGGLDKIYLVGREFTAAARDTGMHTFATVDALSEFLSANPPAGYEILLKGSNGMKLERLIPYL